MTGSSKTLRPIQIIYRSAVGKLKIPPNFDLPSAVSKFSAEWKKTTTHSDEDKQIHQDLLKFFDMIEGICKEFSHFDTVRYAANIKYLIWTLMLYVPWEFLPEGVRRERLKRILQNPDLRQDLWEQHQEDLSKRLSKDPGTALCMSRSVAKALFEFEDIRKAFIDLPLDQSEVFFRDLPTLIVDRPELYAELSEEKKKVCLPYLLNQSPAVLRILIKKIHDQFWSKTKRLEDADALAILEPITRDISQPLSVRSQANFVIATIYVGRHELASARPYLQTLKQSNFGLTEDQKGESEDFLALCLNADSASKIESNLSNELKQIISLCEELNKNLTRYLAERHLSGVFYRLGFFNPELSKNKNNMVKGLISEINTQVSNLKTGKDPESAVAELRQSLIQAEKENKKFHDLYARKIDGDGKLGAMLNSSIFSLHKFIPQNTQEPDSPRGVSLASG